MEGPGNIKHSRPVPPFLRWCSATIPAVFDDSLTYYEALCSLWKWLQTNLVDVVNNNATVTQEYIELVNELKEFVDNYFENLDIQEEINNKLDEMVENGELGVIIAEQYNALRAETNERIDEFESQVNANISDIERRVQEANSGSPLVASSTAGMTQTDRIYVNTTDGKWYYYDGDSWEIGGTYQATAIADGTVSPIKTTFAKRTHQLFNKNYYNVIRGHANLNAETLTGNANSRTLYIPCEGNTTYHLKKTLGSRFGVFSTADIPAAGVDVFNVVYGSGDIAVANQNVEYTTPANANYLCLFYYNSGADTTVSETAVADTIMISEGSTEYDYEPYAYLDIDNLLETQSISREKLKTQFLCYQRGSISLDYANNKVKLNGLDRLIDEDQEKIYSASSDVANSELTFSATSGVFVLTATVNGSSVTSYQLEPFASRNNANKIIMLIDRTYKSYTSYYDYGNRTINEAKNIALYHGNIKINLERRKIYLSSQCSFRYIDPNGAPAAAYNYPEGFVREFDIPTTGTSLQALTATISGNTISSIQFEPYNSISSSNYVILYIEAGYALTRQWYAPFDYGGRITGANTIKPELVSLAMFNSIAAIGDSYTQGSMYMDGHWYNSPNRQGSYIGILGRMNGTDWANYGVGGSTTRSYLTSPNGLPKVLSEDPHDFYFLALGINDAQLGSNYLGSIADITDDYTQNPDTFYGNYAKIIEQVQAHAPKAKFLMVGCMRPRSLNTYYNTYTAAIKEIAEHYGIPFADPYDDAFFNSNILTQTTTATTSYHPTPQAYCGIALALQRLFSTAVEENVEYYYNSNEASNTVTG